MKKLIPLERLDAREDARLRRAGFRTFQGWRQKGRGVRKGEKACRWTSRGTALFHETQTVKMGRGLDFEPLYGKLDFDDCGDPWLFT